MRKAPRIVIYVEDPGAANMTLGLTGALEAAGGSAEIFAAGEALPYLADRGQTVIACPDPEPVIARLSGDADVLAVGTSENPESLAFTLVTLAAERSIPSAGLVDGPANASRRFRGLTDDPFAHAPERLIVPDETSRKAYITAGFDPGQIALCGHPSLDRARQAKAALDRKGKAAVRAEVFPDIDPELPLLLFLAELSDGLDPTEFRRGDAYTLHGRGGADGRTEIVLEEVLDAVNDLHPAPRVVIRLHPKTSAGDFDAYADEIAGFNDGSDTLIAVYAADLVIGLTTALLQESAALGTNTLSVIPRQKEIAWLNGAERMPVVWTRNDLRDRLNEAFERPETFMPAAPGADSKRAATRVSEALMAMTGTTTEPFTPKALETARLRLEPFSEEFLSERYVAWLNDPEVVRFSEQRHQTHTLESCREFVQGFSDGPNGLWAICDKSRALRHVGNISTEIDLAAKSGDIRILIGDKSAWGTGIGAEAWIAVMAHLFEDLGLDQITAGTMTENRGMRRIMEKAGMTETRRGAGPTPLDGNPVEMVYVRCLRADFSPEKRP